jgi:hypothetical protein
MTNIEDSLKATISSMNNQISDTARETKLNLFGTVDGTPVLTYSLVGLTIIVISAMVFRKGAEPQEESNTMGSFMGSQEGEQEESNIMGSFMGSQEGEKEESNTMGSFMGSQEGEEEEPPQYDMEPQQDQEEPQQYDMETQDDGSPPPQDEGELNNPPQGGKKTKKRRKRKKSKTKRRN